MRSSCTTLNSIPLPSHARPPVLPLYGPATRSKFQVISFLREDLSMCDEGVRGKREGPDGLPDGARFPPRVHLDGIPAILNRVRTTEPMLVMYIDFQSSSPQEKLVGWWPGVLTRASTLPEVSCTKMPPGPVHQTLPSTSHFMPSGTPRSGPPY